MLHAGSSTEFVEEVRQFAYAQLLLTTIDEDILRKAYQMDQASFHLSLAQNIFTPDDLLDELTAKKSCKKSKAIRQHSKETLKMKHELSRMNKK